VNDRVTAFIRANRLLILILRPSSSAECRKATGSRKQAKAGKDSPLAVLQHLLELQGIERRGALLVIVEKYEYVASLRLP
jgi:hypothetical protein